MQIYSDKLFKKPIKIIEIFEPENIEKGLKVIEQAQNNNLYLLGYMRYDLSKTANGYPLIYFEAYDHFETFTPKPPNYPVGTIIEPLIHKQEYAEKIEFIKEQIKNGITYEVNYTYPSLVKTNADDFDLYNYFLQKQKTPYNAFIKNKYETILSFSPEMFFSLDDRKIFTKPMKGTIQRGKNLNEDINLKNFLYNDVKNRSENIMIVDLLRNDLGRISKTGTVKVNKLFEIEEHETLFQMTSEISSTLEDNVSLYDIIKAIYPCGSITGAPKHSTMKVIKETEPFSREVYCGAIGYLYKNKTEFSVPIRILQKKNTEPFYKYFAGGAIVWDSMTDDEWNETLTKTKFLQTDLSLIETGIDDFDLHIKRLKNSAKQLGFTWNNHLENLSFQKNVVTRIELFKDGNYKITTRPIPAPAKNPKIKIGYCTNSTNPFLYHKTSIRKSILEEGIFDTIYTNEKGEITEGTFTNIAVKKGNRVFTPPVKCGLLNGIMRQKLLDEGKIEEKVLYPSDLETADKIYCFNSVRKIVEVELC